MKNISFKYLGLIILALGATVVFLVFQATDITSHETNIAATEPKIEAGPASIATTVKSDSTPSTKSNIEKIKTQDDWATPDNLAFIEKWQTERGHLEEEFENYATYSVSDLEKMANAGDKVALEMLPTKYYEFVQNNKDTLSKEAVVHINEKAQQAYVNAAVRGSTRALIRMGDEVLLRGIASRSDEEIKHTLKSTLLFYKTAIIRGDLEAELKQLRLLDRYPQIDISAEDLNEINDKSRDYYNFLSEEREKLGLDSFDNSVPDIVRKYYKTLTDFYLGKRLASGSRS